MRELLQMALDALINGRRVRDCEGDTTYTTIPRNVLPNGLTLLQQNPDCAARLDCSAKDHGWLYTRHPDGQWVTLRKLSDAEIETAWDQAADMAVLQGTQVRGGGK